MRFQNALALFRMTDMTSQMACSTFEQADFVMSMDSGYRFGFNNKENDNEVSGLGNWQDYGMRMYSPRLGRFPSPAPLIIDNKQYPELSTYQFASNTPIQAIDLDGLEAFFVSGTWAGNENHWARSQRDIAKTFGNTTSYSLKWTGKNSYLTRKLEAYTIAKQIYETWDKGGRIEPITLVGHSHGGNLMIEAANILYSEYGVIVDNILTVNTPVVYSHKLNSNLVDKVRHINVFNSNDFIQAGGGNAYSIDVSDDKANEDGSVIYYMLDKGEDVGAGEIGPAGRTFANAISMSYKDQIPLFDSSGCGVSGHCGTSSSNVSEWLPKVEEAIKK
jgi:RHS repeat-associated protein